MKSPFPPIMALPTNAPSATGPGSKRRGGGTAGTREAGRPGALLVLDEIQKVPGWRETVARLWDEDSAGRETPPELEAFSRTFRPQRVLLVGGSGIPLEEFLLRPAEIWMRA